MSTLGPAVDAASSHYFQRVTSTLSAGPSTGTIVALALSGFVAVMAVFMLIACIWCQRGRPRTQSPGFNVDAGIRSSAFFHQFGSALSPTRSGRCSGNFSRHSAYGMQDLHTTRTEPPPLTGIVDRGGPGGRGARDDFPAMLIAQSGHETVDPASPTPYLRVSRPSTFSVQFPFVDQEGHERPRLARSREPSTRSQESTSGLFNAPSRPDSVVDPTMQLPEEAHTASQHRRPSITKVPRLRLDISNPNASASTPRSATSAMRHSPLHTASSSRKSQRTGRRAALGITQSPSPLADTPMSVSTMRFAGPSREGGEGSERTSMDHSVADEVPLPARPKANRSANDLPEWLHLRRAQT